MAVSREGARLARALRQNLPINRSVPLCARGFTSTRAALNASVKADGIADIESTSSFSAPQPDKNIIKAFEESQSQNRTERRLPGNRCVLPSHAHVANAMLI
jgi:large subunit ribosomal protein L5